MRLADGNILNSVRFKLLIPETRNSINEIFGSLLLKQFGFISPETFYVDANINDSKGLYLFQENAAKEMLERNLRREGPIFEGNEELLWSYEDFETMELEDISLSRLVNDSWAKKGITSTVISLSSLIELQRIYLFYAEQKKRSANPYLGKSFKDYGIILLAMNGAHALYPHNRKFYYNAIDQNFEPIYYDGDLRLDLKLSVDALKEDVDLSSFFKNYDSNSFRKIKNDLISADFKEELNSKFISRIPEVIESEMYIETAIKNMIENIETLEEEYLENHHKNQNEEFQSASDFTKNYLQRVSDYQLNDFVVISNIEQIDDQFYLSSSNNDKSFFEIKAGINEMSKMMSDNIFKEKRVEIVSQTNKLNKSLFKLKKFLNGEILFSQGIEFDINLEKKIIFIEQSIPDEWILFKDVDFKDWSIDFVGAKPGIIDSAKQRFNEFGLTGCLNFYNSNFTSSSMKVTAGGCEDSLNIVNSTGSLEVIAIIDSFSDAVDIDFSQIEIDKLDIVTAGNDCFDVSGGDYYILNANLVNCGDKGISVGESSRFRLVSGSVKDSNIGISTKDLSVSSVINLYVENVNICVEAMQKKQEFGGGYIEIDNLASCSSKIFNDSDSIIKIKDNEF